MVNVGLTLKVIEEPRDERWEEFKAVRKDSATSKEYDTGIYS